MKESVKDIVNSLPEDCIKYFKEETKVLEKFFNVNLKTMSAEELSTLLSTLSNAKNAMSVKIIQMETQLKEKQKELDAKLKEIFDKYQVSDISALEEKKALLEKELTEEAEILKKLATE